MTIALMFMRFNAAAAPVCIAVAFVPVAVLVSICVLVVVESTLVL
jgi:hypothetical protein